jgi:hypothetical protein
LLSSLPFGSYLSYSPHGTSPLAKQSITIRKELKRDGYIPTGDGGSVRLIPYAVGRMSEDQPPELAELLGPDVVLVPAPGSAPLPPRQTNVLWVPLRISEELVTAGFGARVAPVLVRQKAVRKSSFAGPGDRPSVQEHYDSMGVIHRIGEPPARIVLVDDVITKGATLLAGASRLAEAFPDADIQAFALLRTQYETAFRSIVDPVYSRITVSRFGAWRRDSS